MASLAEVDYCDGTDSQAMIELVVIAVRLAIVAYVSEDISAVEVITIRVL